MNPDAFYRFIGPKNRGKALIDDELTTCLLDNGAQLNFITPAYVQEQGMDIMSLDYLAQEIGGPIPPIRGIGGIPVEPVGFVMMNVKVPCVQGYDEDQTAIVMDDPDMTECLVILGTPTIYRVMEVIKESEISKLAVPWASSRVSWLMRDIQARLGQVVMNDVANKPILPLKVDEVVRVVSKGKNRNEFVVHTDNNPLTYIFSTANMDAAGQRWVAHLTSYNFTLEYQKGKDNTVADFLSRMDDRLTEGEVQDYLSKIPYPGVKAMLDNAIMPLTDRVEQGVRPNPDCQNVCQEETLGARPARMATTNVTDWKLEQKEDPVLYQVVKHQKASRETFKEALLKVTDKKATTAYVKSKEQLIMKNSLLYRQSKQGPIEETVFQFVVPQIHRSAALDGCHREAEHQGQHHSLSLMQG